MEECLLRRVDVEGGSFAASPKSSRRLLEFSHNFSGQIPAGTAAYHCGNQPDYRSIKVAKNNNIDISHQTARQFKASDFDRFDYIYVMDDSNFRDVTALAPTPEHANKVVKILDELFPGEGLDVPDPYYGGQQGFENVYKMLDQATDVIAKKLQG